MLGIVDKRDTVVWPWSTSEKLDVIVARLDAIERRFAATESRLSAIESRFASIEARISSVESAARTLVKNQHIIFNTARAEHRTLLGSIYDILLRLGPKHEISIQYVEENFMGKIQLSKFNMLLPPASAPDVVKRTLTLMVGTDVKVLELPADARVVPELKYVQGSMLEVSLVDEDEAGLKSPAAVAVFEIKDVFAPAQPGALGIEMLEEVFEDEPVPPVVEEPVPPVVEEPVPPVVEEPVPPVVEEPVPPVVEEPAPPVVEEPAPPVVEEPVAPVAEEPVPEAPVTEMPVEEPVPPVAEEPVVEVPETPIPEAPVTEMPVEEPKEE